MKFISKFIKLLILSTISILPSTAFSDSRLDNCLLYKEQIVSILESENISSDYFYLAKHDSTKFKIIGVFNNYTETDLESGHISGDPAKLNKAPWKTRGLV